MATKTLGYALAGAGTLGVLLLFEPIKTFLGFDFFSRWGLGDTLVTIISLALLAIGAFVVSKHSKSLKLKEVPIYHEKNVVGFRRIKQ